MLETERRELERLATLCEEKAAELLTIANALRASARQPAEEQST